MNALIRRSIIVLLSIATITTSSIVADDTSKPITILNPTLLAADDIKAVRTPLGISNDYKPFLTKLKSGGLLAVAFCFGPVDGIDGYVERAIFWRSNDGGKTWGPREERIDIQGREFGLTTLHDGTLLMTCHWLSRDALNPSKRTHSKIFRSTNEGKTWSEIRIGPDGFPDEAMTTADWMAFELPDPKQPGKFVTYMGVGMHHGGAEAPKHAKLWRSHDSGKTWDRSLNPDTKNWIDVDGFFSQTVTFRTASGKLLHPVRVDRSGPHWLIPGTEQRIKKEGSDQGDRMMLWVSKDSGRSFAKHNTHGNFGDYGEMYPRFLQLQDGRILLTFTVRSHSTDGHELGLRAILNRDDGKTWHFRKDRMVISDVNTGSSGGGFGNSIQIDDGSMVTIYSYRKPDKKTYIETVRWQLPKDK
ncbi:MAG: hypothetical protein CMJ78_15325 [Planctomycetaceae bacterium]|nr:hypothetical protein [Planctomycetaceae bacterium]